MAPKDEKGGRGLKASLEEQVATARKRLRRLEAKRMKLLKKHAAEIDRARVHHFILTGSSLAAAVTDCRIEIGSVAPAILAVAGEADAAKLRTYLEGLIMLAGERAAAELGVDLGGLALSQRHARLLTTVGVELSKRAGGEWPARRACLDQMASDGRDAGSLLASEDGATAVLSRLRLLGAPPGRGLERRPTIPPRPQA